MHRRPSPSLSRSLCQVRRLLPPSAALLWLCSTLGGCASPPAAVAVSVKPPPELLDCAPEPPPPDLAAMRWDQAEGDSVVKLRVAGADCRAKLGAVKAWWLGR